MTDCNSCPGFLILLPLLPCWPMLVCPLCTVCWLGAPVCAMLRVALVFGNIVLPSSSSSLPSASVAAWLVFCVVCTCAACCAGFQKYSPSFFVVWLAVCFCRCLVYRLSSLDLPLAFVAAWFSLLRSWIWVTRNSSLSFLFSFFFFSRVSVFGLIC